MSEISTLLNSLYANDTGKASLEKTAEDHLLAALRTDGQVGENPYAHMSTEELMQILNSSEKVASAAAEDEVPDMLLEKTAAEMLSGQVMAHAMVHEMGLIKEACANGLCRVCKEQPFDVQGSTVCSDCLGQA